MLVLKWVQLYQIEQEEKVSNCNRGMKELTLRVVQTPYTPLGPLVGTATNNSGEERG